MARTLGGAARAAYRGNPGMGASDWPQRLAMGGHWLQRHAIPRAPLGRQHAQALGGQCIEQFAVQQVHLPRRLGGLGSRATRERCRTVTPPWASPATPWPVISEMSGAVSLEKERLCALRACTAMTWAGMGACGGRDVTSRT